MHKEANVLYPMVCQLSFVYIIWKDVFFSQAKHDTNNQYEYVMTHIHKQN